MSSIQDSRAQQAVWRNDLARLDKFLRKYYFRIIAIVVLLLIAVLSWWILNLYVNPASAGTPKDVVTTRKDIADILVKILGGLVAAGGLAFTWGQLRVNQKTLEQTRDNQQKTLELGQATLESTQEHQEEQLKVTIEGLKQTQENQRETLGLSRRSEVNERFTRAIDQLGATDGTGKARREIRMGGIHALEKIAQDSPQDYHEPIMRILAAYVRENAHWRENAHRSSEEESAIAASDHKEPTADITTALTVLSSLLVFGREQSYVKSIKPFDDHGESSDESSGDRDESSLDRDLVDIRRTDLEGAHLEGIDLQEVRLGHSNLQKAHLDNANLQKARLRRANLQKAHLDNANLQKAHLRRANLQKAHLDNANLQKAHLRRANLQGADLVDAHVEGTDLREAIGLTPEMLAWAFGDEATQLPEGLERPAHWLKQTERRTDESSGGGAAPSRPDS